MGMLLTYREGYYKPAKAKRTRKPRNRKPKATPAPPASPYSELTDEQVAEAYSLTIPEGEATERNAQVVELRAVAAYAHTFADQLTESGSDSE